MSPMPGKLKASLSVFACAVLGAASASLGDEPVEFNRDVRPILANRCFTCHGPDSVTREAGLRLDQRDSATQPADSGEVPLVPGDASQSELMRRILSDGEDRMPPEGSGDPLDRAQIKTLSAWIEQGGEYQDHWSFIAPEQQAVPADRSGRAINEIDRFVHDRLLREGLSPAPSADRETLIRRVAFALTGLPPTLQEIDRFLNDSADGAYERMVDRYFDSPEYGEHMARHWLDLARYADSNGYQYDTERQQWAWRDWVIDAYNRNLPFDQFTIEQLAGDLLPDSTPQQRLATGFNRNHGITIEGGIISEEYRTEYVMDRVVTTGQVWLGLTMGCARCHDHKYDPISQKEFYQVFAFFNQVPERGNSGFDPREKIPSPLQETSETESRLKALRQELSDPVEVETHLDAWLQEIVGSEMAGWTVLQPETATSSGGSTLKMMDDHSILAGGANPNHDTYEITATTQDNLITAIRLEALTHPSLPGGGPGRHSNSNFVLSELELIATSVADPTQSQTITFNKAIADYSQKNYEVHKAIDGRPGNSGWAVDGPTRKENATAAFFAEQPFGYEGGTKLLIRLTHDAGFRTHGVGRPRLSVTTDAVDDVSLHGLPGEIRRLARFNESERSEVDQQKLRKYFLDHHDPRDSIKQQIAKLEGELAARIPATMVMKDMPNPRKTFVLRRGQYDAPADEVDASTPQIFPGMPKGSPSNRLGFARWLVSPDHPLTARVAVNRYWQRLFGTGLVKTSEDFGVQGELPSHPELLDYLAIEFIRSGWDIRHIQRLMLTSATFRQSADVDSDHAESDPDNRLLSRGPMMRLDGEEIRDSMLLAGGLLVKRIGGPSVYPYQPAGLWMELNNRPGYSKAYPQGVGNDLYRRSMYTFWKRTVPSPMMTTFDAPQREFCTIRRSRTNTPLQALLLMNGPQFVEAARNLGQKMVQEAGQSTDERIIYAFRRLTSREPSAEELSILRDVYEEQRQRCRDPEIARATLGVGQSTKPTDLDSSEVAAATEVARLLMNLSEAITK